MVRYDRLVSRSLFSVKIVFLYLFHNALTIFTHEKTKEKIIQLFECRWRTIKNEKIMHKLFFITVLCLMPISKKHPFPHQKRQMMFFIPLCRRNCCERWYDREASLSSRMQIRIIFFAALIVDPFVFFPRKRSVFKKQPEDDRWEFFFIVKFFFSFSFS